MPHISELKINICASILEVMKKIDENQAGMALIVDSNNILLGVVTDGDIRRAAIKGIGLSENISKAMNNKPLVAIENTSPEQLDYLLKTHRVTHIPIVNNLGQCIDLFFKGDASNTKVKNNLVFIMAGGLGSRLGELTAECPKPLLEVAGKPILEHIIRFCMGHGFRNFVLAVNHLGHKIEKYFADGSNLGASISYVKEEKKLGTAGPLGLLKTISPEPVLVMNGDVLTRANLSSLIEFHAQNRSKATIGVLEYESQIPYGVIETKGIKVQNIIEKPITKNFISAGIYLINPELFVNIPQNEYLDMPEFIKILLNKKIDTNIFPIYEYWQDIGHKDELELARKNAQHS
jgi:dTDP-glucose pyrophosphorylase